jgi:preprotein translocase subunit SecG
LLILQADFMFTVLLIIHLVLCVLLVATILMQRSEGGALGIGGGPAGLVSGRSATNFMTRSTQVLGAAFFITSIGLSLIAARAAPEAPTSVMGTDATTSNEIPTEGIDLSVPETKGTGGGLLDLPAAGAAAPAAPPAPEPAAPAEPAPKQ